MRRVFLPVFLFCLQSASGQVATIQGTWNGMLNAGVTKLHVVLHVEPDGTVKLDSPDQGNIGVPVNDVKVIGTHISGLVPALNGSFEGELTDGATKIQGKWKRGLSFPITFARMEDPPGLRRPQMPKPPFPYRQEDVVFASLANDIRLAGTLTLPSGPGPFPAVVMITGSGPQDRDETMAGHKPFWVIADYLSRHGVAVLRVDDRGTGKSTGDFSASTTQDFADDVEGAVNYLKSRREAGSIGLIGHSEGGVIAPMVANRSADVKFVVLMAGTAIPGDQVFAESTAGPGDQLAQANTPWYSFFASYDPAPALRELKQPVLALNGSLDVQVFAAHNLPAIGQSLEEGDNNDYQIVKLAGLNHMFQTAKTGSPEEYATIEQTIAPEVLELIAGWIDRHSK